MYSRKRGSDPRLSRRTITPPTAAPWLRARNLEVDPVMCIDVIERDAVARPQHLDQDPPRRNLRVGRPARDVGIVAGKFHADRGVLVDLMIGLAVVDISVVVAICAVG